MFVTAIIIAVVVIAILGGLIQGWSQVGTYQEARRIRQQNER